MALGLLKFGTPQIERLNLQIAAMGGMVEQQLSDAITAVEKRDIALAERIIREDAEVDRQESEIEEAVIQLMEGRKLMGNDLRHAVSGLKIASDLERIGDLAKNTAKRSLVISREDAAGVVSGVTRMGRIALRQVTDVLNAMQNRNAAGAVAVWGGDEEIDELYNSIFRQLLTLMMRDPGMVNASTHIVFIAKNLERVGDHATNIAEYVYYNLTGEQLEAARPKQDITSFTSVADVADTDMADADKTDKEN